MANKSEKITENLQNDVFSPTNSNLETQDNKRTSGCSPQRSTGEDMDWPRRKSDKFSSKDHEDQFGNQQQSQSELYELSVSENDTKTKDRDLTKNLQRKFGIILPDTNTVSEEKTAPSVANAFANDGSFMAMFRKKAMEVELEDQMQKEAKGVKRTAEISSDTEPVEKKIIPTQSSSSHLPIVGRRRGPKMLKTGMVAKKAQKEEKEEEGKDAWSKYLAEVRKYKSQKCIEDDGGGTPLVK